MEASASCSLKDFSLLAGYFFRGDSDRSVYIEGGYGFYKKNDINAILFVGAGNGIYLKDSEDFNVVNVGITASKSSLSVSYILNPQAETNYLVVCYSL